jgi:AraC family transcriptional regulator
MIQSVTVESLPARRVAAIAHTGSYQELGPVFQRLAGWAARRGLFARGCSMLGVYYDDPRTTEPSKLRSEACVEVDDQCPGDPAAGITVKSVPGGRYAVGIHKGPYQKLGESYAWLSDQWMRQNAHDPADGPCYEVYLNNPQTTTPDELLTAIHVPIRK